MMYMRKPFRFALLLLSLLLLAASSWQTGRSQTTGSEFFPQTRHSVSAAFLEAYRAVPNPEVVYGYPITEAFTSRDGLRVQYFQRARFEKHGETIRLTPIGRELYQPGRPEADFNTSPGACRPFETGFQVCMAFLDFYDAHGATRQFGLPISGIEKDGLRYVQYFEYARLEWYPESDDPRLEVQLGPLGRLYFDQAGEDAAFLRPASYPGIIEITTLRVHAFPAAPASTGSGVQPVFIIVQDQAYSPIPDAEVRVAVTFPGGERLTYAGSTNSHGFIEVPLEVDSASSGGGLALVEATAGFDGLESSTLTSFRITP